MANQPGQGLLPANLFTSIAHDLAAHGLSCMGVDSTALEVEVKLYKLLLYEAGGHFKFHRDTEKEVGMFATMIVQLPTASGYTGGTLTVRQGRQSCDFDFSEGSDNRCFWTVFFCDCEHQLNQVVSGSRLCLVFSLVRNNADFIPAANLPLFISALPQVKSLLQLWADEDGEVEARKEKYYDKKRKLLAIPLVHKYSKSSLSFAGLKGHDRVVAALVRACDFLELHLCMLTKHRTETDDSEVEHVIDNWIAVDDKPAKFEQWCIDIEKQVLRADVDDGDGDGDRDLFDFLEDEHQGYGLSGNQGGTDEYFYHVAVLVVWPKDKRMDTICLSDHDTIEWLRETYFNDTDPPGSEETKECFQHLVRKFEESETRSYRSYILYPSVEALTMLLQVCVKSGLDNEALYVMKRWGVRLVGTEEFACAVRAFGWQACREIVGEVIQSVRKTCHDNSRHLKNLAIFPSSLRDEAGYQEGAIEAAKLLCEELISKFGCKNFEEHVECLLEFCLEVGLKEEASQMWRKLTLQKLSGAVLAKVVHYSLPDNSTIVDFVGNVWDELKKMVEDKKVAEEKMAQNGKKQYQWEGMCEVYLKKMAQFVLLLETLGHRDLAMAFAARPFPCSDYVAKKMELRDMSLWLSSSEWTVLALLMNKAEIILDERMRTEDAVMTMKSVGGLVGLKNNDAMKNVLIELCKDFLPQVVDNAEGSCVGKEVAEVSIFGCKQDFTTWEDQMEFFKLLFWLEDEELLEEMVKLVSKRMDVVKRMIDDGVMEEASKCGDGVKGAMKKLVDARMEYNMREPSFDDVMEICRSSSKRLKICGEFDSLDVARNPREQRKLHEMRMQKWKDGSVSSSTEMERLQALRAMF